MIDPAIIDMMQHMGRQPPALVQAIAPSTRIFGRTSARLRAVSERETRLVESEVTDWVAAGHSQLEALVRAYDSQHVEVHHLAMLAQMIAAFERVAEEEAAAYRRIEKKVRRLEKQIIAAFPPDAVEIFKTQRSRLLNALARWGAARWEVTFALRALYARHHVNGLRGPVFDDPKALGDYLRAAVA